MNSYQKFHQRASHIPYHGLGLSVDVYSPNLFELMTTLEHHALSPDYLEIFKASHQALKAVRARLPSMALNYHADGLWVTQPDWTTAYPVKKELDTATDHLQELGSSWLNHECASKQMAGYSFGTYLPPLFTKASAAITAENATATQEQLDDQLGDVVEVAPLLLLETPPLTYFGFGDLSYPEFFRHLTESCSCGVVLDIGHIWTVYRYGGAWRGQPLEAFLDTFLQAFPLDRVVQIHLAGLDHHPALELEKTPQPPNRPNRPNWPEWPEWIDSHNAPIPEVLWNMLDRVLRSSDLVNLKGMALEVDTKPIELIVEEFASFRKRFEWWPQGESETKMKKSRSQMGKPNTLQPGLAENSKLAQDLGNQYRQYAEAVTGRDHRRPDGLVETFEASEHNLQKYVDEYLPYEILVWGGDLREMFPQTVQALDEQGIDLSTFVQYWHRSPRPLHDPYDFFLLKIAYFLDFVEKISPSTSALASQEATELRQAYALASAPPTL